MDLAVDVRFSPFQDLFENVILDGAIINDYEAMINLNKVKSFNDSIIITKEVISVWKR